MARTIIEASDEYRELVDDIFQEHQLNHFCELEVFRFTRIGKEVIKVVKANELAERMSQRDDVVVVIVAEEIFDMVDAQTKRVWIENALAQVGQKESDGTLELGKEPQVKFCIGTYDFYNEKGLGNDFINKIQLQALSIQQYKDEEKKRKAEEKAAKKTKKNFGKR